MNIGQSWKNCSVSEHHYYADANISVLCDIDRGREEARSHFYIRGREKGRFCFVFSLPGVGKKRDLVLSLPIHVDIEL